MGDAAPGFYGKVPALGDFCSRRLPAAFAGTWDRFLADMVQASRVRLGAAWLAAWNEAPVWHFGLGSGLVGEAAWLGVLIPSVDRVGRQFPFSILGPEAAGGLAYSDWTLRIEALALAALDDDFHPQVLATDLERLGPPGLSPSAPGHSVWSCRDSPRMSACQLRFSGLPSTHEAARLVAG